MKQLIAIVLFAGVVVGAQGTAHATNYVIYAQGRGNANWSTSERVNLTGQPWTAVTIAYDGGASMNGPATATLRTQLEQKCATSTGNTCVVVCHSAGCMRVLKAIQDSTVTMFNIPRVSAAGSAAGGTKIAEAVTTGSLKSIAKLIGQQEAVDWDLTPAVARGSFGYIQNAMTKTSGTMFHYAGYKDTCALIAGGTVRCWGDNFFGQIGDGTQDTRTTPANVMGLTGVTQISVGYGHACARKGDGTLACWGNNEDGQLGTVPVVLRTMPVDVLLTCP